MWIPLVCNNVHPRLLFAEITNPLGIIIVAALGLVVNILGLFMFHGHGGHSHGHGHGHGHGGRTRDAPHVHKHGPHEHVHKHPFEEIVEPSSETLDTIDEADDVDPEMEEELKAVQEVC